MMAKFLKVVRFSELVGFWKEPKPVRPLSFFIRLNVICSNYGGRCKSEDFHEKEDWRRFEQILFEEGWKVTGENIFCPSCCFAEIDR